MSGVAFKQLWVGGERGVRAREPELGSFYQYVGLLPTDPGSGFTWRGENSSCDKVLSALEVGTQAIRRCL